MNHKTLSSEYIFRHKYFTARRDAYQSGTGKIIDPYFVVEIPAAAAAMAITEDQQIVMVRQYRHAIGSMSLELPGGFIDENEKAETAIGRELEEETGYRFEKIYSLGTTYANPGILNNPTHMFLAAGGRKVGEQKLDPNEEIEILLKSFDEVNTLLSTGEIKQGMHVLLLLKGLEQIKNGSIIL